MFVRYYGYGGGVSKKYLHFTLGKEWMEGSNGQLKFKFRKLPINRLFQ